MRKMILCLSLVLPGAAPAAPVPVHGRFEQTLTASRDYDAPWELEARVRLEGPGGVKAQTLAFWDGGRTWRFRFSPERAGRWQYTVQSSDAALNGKSGTFQAVAYRGENLLYRHGAPRLAANRRYFVHADGTPWFWLACTGWNSALLATDSEWTRYLEDRKAKKFTAIQFVMTAPWRAALADENGKVAFSGVEKIRIHPDFFQRMDRRVDELNDRGLVGIPVMLWALTSPQKESPGEVLPEDQAALLARYMAARYSAHHLLWFLGGDGDYRGEKASRWKRIGRAVFTPELFRRPVSLHPRGMQDPWPDLQGEAWIDFFTYQTGHGNNAKKWEWNARGGTASGMKLRPPRPVIDAEPNYELHIDYHTRRVIGEAQVRRAAYYSLLAAPPAGITYGAHGIWSFERKPAVPLNHERAGVAPPWHEALDAPGAKQMKILYEIFTSLEWWKLRPDRSLLASEPATPDWTAYPMPARSEDSRFALIYLPANPVVRLNLSKFPRGVKGTWIDPASGQRSPAGTWKPEAVVEIRNPAAPSDRLLLLQ